MRCWPSSAAHFPARIRPEMSAPKRTRFRSAEYGLGQLWESGLGWRYSPNQQPWDLFDQVSRLIQFHTGEACE